METSDSEYFESADEELYSDDEITKKKDKDVLKIEKQISNLRVSREENVQKIPHILGNIDVENKNEKSTEIEAPAGPRNTLNNVTDDTKKLKQGTEQIQEHSWNEGWEIDDKDSMWKMENFAPQIEKSVIPELKSTNQDGWANDDWVDFDDIDKVNIPLSHSKQDKNEGNSVNALWGTWGNWDVSTILSTATQGVSTITNQMSQGLTTVLENGMGIPDPGDLAKMHLEEERKLIGDETGGQEDLPIRGDENSSGFVFGNLSNIVSGVSNLTKFVESTSTKVISGGLDTLETIGKKTMAVLQDGDPGLKRKRAFLKLDQDKPVLSQVLREAKEKAERESNSRDTVAQAVKKFSYETLFDDHNGLVHLEALEMLSKQCEIKLKRLIESCTDEALTEMQETMDQVKELCELPDEEEEEQLSLAYLSDKLRSAVQEMNIGISYEKLISSWEETEQWLNTIKQSICDEHELHQQAIETLAQLTAIAVEQYHKTGELLLVKEHRSTADEADSLVQLTTTLTCLLGNVAGKFSDKLNSRLAKGISDKETINSLITNIFFEAANSSSYIQDAFHLLIPVLQVGAV